MEILIDERGQTVCGRCEVADRIGSRFFGLMGRRSLDADRGMLFTRTGSVHTFFMRFPIDVVFLDRSLRVRKIVPGLRRNRLAASRGAKNVLELPAGAAARAGLEVGARLAWSREG
jgi:uncharacterized membrane protein (UPF0127 family)